MTQDSDEHLTQFLLGELPEAEAERIEELSISNDALAARLRELEDEMVDRYARGASDGVMRTRLERAYRESRYLQKRVQFAEALHAWTAKDQAVRRDPSSSALRPLRNWAMAAAAILLIAAGANLVRTNQRLRSEVAHIAGQRLAVETENAELQRQLQGRPVPSTTPSAPVIATFVLRPPRRGTERDATAVTLRRGTTLVAFRLEVESDAYPRFWAGLRDLASDPIVWRSPDVAAEPAGANRIATIVVPAEILRSQRYAIELTGVGKSGESELLAVYAVRVTFE